MMRKSWTKWILIAVIALALIVGVPIIINECYKTNSGYMTIWGAADALAYYGAIIASVGAAVGIYVSIKYSHKQYRVDKRRGVLPYFAVNILGRKCIDPFDLGWYADENGIGENETPEKEALTYREFLYDKCFFILTSKKIECVRELSKEQDDARKVGITVENHGELGYILENDKRYIPIKAINVGNGCAINTTITINSIDKHMDVTSIPVSVPVGNEIYTGLLFYIDEGLSGKYDYIIQYYDIYGNRYEHHKTIVLQVDRNTCSIQITQETTHAWMKEESTHANT